MILWSAADGFVEGRMVSDLTRTGKVGQDGDMSSCGFPEVLRGLRGALVCACGLVLLAGSARAVTITLWTNNVVMGENRTFQMPITASDPDGQPLHFAATTSNKKLRAVFAPSSNRSLLINVSGVDSNTNAFTGDLVLQLFEDLAPTTTARIVTLVNSNFYNGLLFQRVFSNFVAQCGGATNDPNLESGVTINDEYVASLIYDGFGQLGMANLAPGTHDSNDSQFFITDVDLSISNTNHPSPEYLNFLQPIFGQLTSGFNVLTQIMSTAVIVSGLSSTPVSNVVINSATIITNSQDTVLRLTAAPKFPGASTDLVTVIMNSTDTVITNSTDTVITDSTDTVTTNSTVSVETTNTVIVATTNSVTVATTNTVTVTTINTVTLTTTNTITVATNIVSETTNTITVVTTTNAFTATTNSFVVLTNTIGEVTVTVSATNAENQVATQTFQVDVVIDTNSSPPFLEPIPAGATVTQAMATSFDLTYTNIYTNGTFFVVTDLATGAYPTNMLLSLDSHTKRLWMDPDVTLTGKVSVSFGVSSANQSTDTHVFVLNVLPRSATPTMTLVPLKGSIVDVTNNATGSRISVTGTFAFNSQSDQTFGSNDVMELDLGDPSNPLTATLTPSLPGWKWRNGSLSVKAQLSSLKSSEISAQFNIAKKTFAISARGFDFPSPLTNNEIQVGVSIGSNYGTDVRPWVEIRPHTFVPPPPLVTAGP
jgi:cyclophilin family peptidyl-prolyl cis-trans isomerase